MSAPVLSRSLNAAGAGHPSREAEVPVKDTRASRARRHARRDHPPAPLARTRRAHATDRQATVRRAPPPTTTGGRRWEAAGHEAAGRFPPSLRGSSRGAPPTAPSPDASAPPPPEGRSPRPEAGPRSPTLRANPFPEVTDPFCRLPLPTLFRWLEALHLGDLMRLWVRPGGNTIAVPQVFMGRWGASRTPRRLGRPASRPALSPGEPIPGSSGRVPPASRARLSGRKENPPRGLHRRPWAPSRCRVGPSPAVGSGILTRFPFGRGRDPPPPSRRGRGASAQIISLARNPLKPRDRAPSERVYPMP